MSNSDNNTGCLGLILTIILVWALLFGITINGKHYGLHGCDGSNGVIIDK